MPNSELGKAVRDMHANAADISGEIQDSDRTAKWLDTHQARLTELRPNQWVATRNCRIVGFFPDLEGLLKAVDGKAISRMGLKVLFLDPNPPTLILSRD